MSTHSEDLQRAYMFARNWAKARGAQELTPEHVLWVCCWMLKAPPKK